MLGANSCIKVLVEDYGVEVTSINDLDHGALSMLCLSSRGSSDTLELLHSTGKIDINRCSSRSRMSVKLCLVCHVCAFLQWFHGKDKTSAAVRLFANLSNGTALHCAAERGNLPLTRTLLALGANPTLRNERGDRPYDIALRKHYMELAAVFSRAQEDWVEL